jgi:hypothetical protein
MHPAYHAETAQVRVSADAQTTNQPVSPRLLPEAWIQMILILPIKGSHQAGDRSFEASGINW